MVGTTYNLKGPCFIALVKKTLANYKDTRPITDVLFLDDKDAQIKDVTTVIKEHSRELPSNIKFSTVKCLLLEGAFQPPRID